MLEILDAIQFERIFTKGGRTEPWLVQVLVEEERTPYVVKLFTTEQVDYDHAVAREVFGAILAREFDLSIPEPALIRFSKAFMGTLPEEVRNITYFRDERLKFGSAYCDNTTLLSPDLPLRQVNKFIHDIANIYAFDTLINNKDRGNYKTNILISNQVDEYFIFDHERAFKHIGKLLSEIKHNQFSEILPQHVLHKYLRSRKNKNELFATFYEYLRVLNIDILDSYNNELKEHGLDSNEIIELKSYLYALKQKADWFVKVLVNSVSK